MSTAVVVTLFGGPADGRTMSAPADAQYVDMHVRHGQAMFDPTKHIGMTTHRYWIERSSSGTHGIGLHQGPVAYRADEEQPLGA